MSTSKPNWEFQKKTFYSNQNQLINECDKSPFPGRICCLGNLLLLVKSLAVVES